MSNKSKKRSNKREFDDVSSLISTLGSEAKVGYQDFPISEIPGQPVQPAQVTAPTEKMKAPPEERPSPASFVPADERAPLDPEELRQSAAVVSDGHGNSAIDPSVSHSAVIADENPTVLPAEEFFVGVYTNPDVSAATPPQKEPDQAVAPTSPHNAWEWGELLPPEQRKSASEPHPDKADWLQTTGPTTVHDSATDVAASPASSDRAEEGFWLLPVEDRSSAQDAHSVTATHAARAHPTEQIVSSQSAQTDQNPASPPANRPREELESNDSQQKVLNSLTNRFRDSFLRGVEKAHLQMQTHDSVTQDPSTCFKRVQTNISASQAHHRPNADESRQGPPYKSQSRLDDYWSLPTERRRSSEENKKHTAQRSDQPLQRASNPVQTINQTPVPRAHQTSQSSDSSASPTSTPANQTRSPKSPSMPKKNKSQRRGSKRRPRP